MRKDLISLLLLLLLLVSCQKGELMEIERRPTINKQDSLAMVAFYHSMKCAEWKGGFHWDLKDYTTWGGVTGVLNTESNEYRITEICVPEAKTYLPDGYSLPAELGNLTELRVLVVYGDQRAMGGIPPELFNCPLESLFISGRSQGDESKGFTGTIPKEIEKVGNTLVYLSINNTGISGEIPEEITALQKLEYPIRFYSNEFTGRVPLHLRELRYAVDLDHNKFTEMDWTFYLEDIGFVPSLKYNQLSGDIPEEVLSSERWKTYYVSVTNQKEGYGYDEKYF